MILIIAFLMLMGQFEWSNMEPIRSSHANNQRLDEIALSTTKHISNVLICDFSHESSNPESKFEPNKPCHLDYHSFSFSAYFRNKNLLKASSLKYIAQTLSENTICDVKYMKYNFEKQNLEYFHSGDSFYWYEGKTFNQTQQPEVLILKDTVQYDRKKVVFKCKLPKSDVYLSLNGGDEKSFRQAQSYPLPSNRVTVSAFHVKLSFLEMEGLNIDLKKQNEDLVTDNFLDFSSQNFLNKNLFKNKKAPERFLILHDSKCRKCELNAQMTSFDPMRSNSILCSLKKNSCEFEGACYQNREIYTPLNYLTDESQKPNTNMFVCNSEYSQTSLFMPCSISNGNCQKGQTCVFNSTSFEVKCV